MSAAGTPFSLGTGEVHVWWIDLTHVAEGDAAALAPDERTRAARLRQPRFRQQWIGARVAMRHILAGYSGVAPDVLRLATAAHGKPELVDDPSLRFSLTHAGHRAALAVAWQREVGIDLEALDPSLPGRQDLPALMATASTTAEAARIAALAEEERLKDFLKIWTLKEAYLKGIGAGLMVEPRTLEVTLGEDGRASIHEGALIEGERGKQESRGLPAIILTPNPSPGSTGEGLGVRELVWTLRLLDPGPGWVAALAVAGSEPEITARHWPFVPG